MRVTILNGNPNGDNRQFDKYLELLSEEILVDGHDVDVLPLRNMDLKYCIGCFDCWVKTPGVCVTDDQGREVCRAQINSDFVLWASPVIMGFYSALLKKVTDKFIGLVHPYAEFVDGLSRHQPRYGRDAYPQVGLLLEKEMQSQANDGGWWPTWQWNQYEEDWNIAKQEWAGKITVDCLIALREFGMLESFTQE